MHIQKLLQIILLSFSMISCISTSDNSSSVKEAAKSDLAYLKKFLKENHPAPLNKQDTDFANWLEKGYDVAKSKLDSVKTTQDHFHLLSQYLKGFEGNHLSLSPKDNKMNKEIYWPGFNIIYSQGQFLVLLNADNIGKTFSKLKREIGKWSSKKLPPMGARLISCDGKKPDELINLRINSFRNKNETKDLAILLRETRNLFYDLGSAFSFQPKTCLFKTKNQELEVSLEWKKVSEKTLGVLAVLMHMGHHGNKFAVDKFGKSGLWVYLPTFKFNSKNSETYDQMIRQLQSLKTSKTSLIAFDLRGNMGGSTYRFQQLLTESLSVEAADHSKKCINQDYEIYRRVSEANIDYLTKGEASAKDDYLKSYYKNQKNDFIRARQEDKNYLGMSPEKINQPFKSWTKTNDLNQGHCDLPKALNSPVPRIVAIFDFYCASACIMFLDHLAQFKNAIFLGQPSQKRDLYLEIINGDLPSGIGKIRYPVLFQRNPNLRQYYHPRIWYYNTEISNKELKRIVTKTLASEFGVKNF